MMGLTVQLSHAPNPDIAGGYWDEPVDPPEARHAVASGLQQAQNFVNHYIARNSLGGGNWTGGKLMLDGQPIGFISYNGRAWVREGEPLLCTDATVLGVYAKPVREAAARGRK